MTTATRKVPRSVLALACGPMQFAEAPEKPAEGSKPRAAITMFARSPEPVAHWYWGRIVHDMTGMKLRKDTAPIDYCHDRYELIGVLNEFKADEKTGLTVSGELIAFKEDDKAAEVIYKGQAKIPYEASIDWSGPARIEEIGEGITVQVNGRDFTGPGYVAREWELRSVAVCPYGVDSTTRTQFAEGDEATDDDFEITLFSESGEPTMPTGKAPAAPANNTQQQSEQPAGGTVVPPVVTQQQSADAGRQAVAAELKKFTEKFGPVNGAKYFTEGLSYEAGLEQHVTVLSESLTAKDREIGELKAKLDAVPRGEETPATFSDGGDKPADQANKKFAHLGDNVSKIAAGIKLPGRK